MDTDVAVVGAGAAGLAAALWLAEHSVRVIVLEGRDRVGGRVRWETVGSVGLPAELGAEFIHGDAPETSAFLREAGLRKVEAGDQSWTCAAGGSLQPSTDDFTSNDVFERVRSLPEDESVDAFLRRFDNDPALRVEALRARTFVEGFEAADPAIASARAIADELSSGVDATVTRPLGSYAPLFGYLATRCETAGIDLRLATTVEQIVWQPGSVTIAARARSGGVSTVRARCAVITVPVGVLQQAGGATPLSFVPPLPAAKEAAIGGLAMGHVVRVTLAFRSPFWERLEEGRYRDAAFFRCDGGAFNAFWTQVPQRERSIVAWAGGPRASALGNASVRARIELARDEFGALFGERDLARAEFEDGVTHDWAADPLACGAYSYVKTHGATARANLGVPIDATLFFAGEACATDGQGGTVSGAFETGQRAARQAAGALELANPPSQIAP